MRAPQARAHRASSAAERAASLSIPKEAEASKAEGRFWALTTVAQEAATNPFFRAGEGALAAAVGLVGAPAGEVFAALREAKNRF